MTSLIVISEEDGDGGERLHVILPSLDDIPDKIRDDGEFYIETWIVGEFYPRCDWMWNKDAQEWFYWERDTSCKEYCWRKRGDS